MDGFACRRSLCVPAAIGVVALLKLYQADPASGDARLAWQGGALLLFVSLIFPLQFEREWITLGWALEGLALLWLFHRVPHRGCAWSAVVLLCAAFVRLAFNPAVLEYHRRSGTRIWNWYLYAYGITSGLPAPGARLFGRPRETLLERAAPPLLGSLGVILVFLLLNIEIADYFSIGPTLTFSFSGNFARDMTYSIAWALFALGLIIAGMRIKQTRRSLCRCRAARDHAGEVIPPRPERSRRTLPHRRFRGRGADPDRGLFIYQRFLAPERT